MESNNMCFSDELKIAKKYWTSKLSGEIGEERLIRGISNELEYKEGRCRFRIDKNLSGKLYDISNNQDLTIYVVLLAALKTLLFKYTGQNDIVIGSPLFSKNDQVVVNNNCIPLRDSVTGEMTFKELLMNIKQTVSDGYRYQSYPIKKLSMFADSNSNPALYRIIALLNNVHSQEPIADIIYSSDNDITFSFTRRDEEIEYEIIFNSLAFDCSLIQGIAESYTHVLDYAMGNINTKLIDIPLVSQNSLKKIFNDFNTTDKEYALHKTVHQIFEEQVEKTPDNIAVLSTIDSTRYSRLTYRELNQKANCLAAVLRKKGVSNNTIVAIMAEPSIDLAVGILGILKAGGAYLPIDTEYPLDRIHYMMKDSGATILITYQSITHEWEFDGEIIDIDNAIACKHDGTNPENINTSRDLAYIIYTSGSTGNPKAALIEHRSLVNFISWRIEEYGFNERDISLQLLSPSFDGFGTNFYSSLLSGGKLVIVGKNFWRDINRIVEIIKEMQVTNMSVIPSMYGAILESAKPEDLISLRFVVVAAEKSGKKLIELSNSLNNRILLINEYGPTECTVTATAFIGLTPQCNSIIGKPISNTRIYILNKFCDIMPIGVFGEMYISGDGLARGYLNQSTLTDEKFVKNPFISGQRMYRTGDVARWLPDGNIELGGRLDFQVKVSGFRIELEEIQEQLLKNSFIKAAAVVAKNDVNGNKFICAYYVSDNELTIQEIIGYLKEKLPEYMLPSQFIMLDKMPLTASGKTDRKFLENVNNNNSLVEFVAPVNEVEENLAFIWRQVLGLEVIGVNHNFFDLGGDSLKVFKVYALLEKQYRGVVTLISIFSYPTIKKLAKYIMDKSNYLIL